MPTSGSHIRTFVFQAPAAWSIAIQVPPPATPVSYVCVCVCPICLELLTEPLSLDCGHSFCQACNTANNKESVIGLEGERRCPVFRIKYEPVNLRPHWHLASIVEWLREVKVNLEEQERNLSVPWRESPVLL